MKPKYLVLDEPNTGLDERGLQDLINVIKNLRREGSSIILVTHDIELVLEVADKVLLLKDGELKFFGSTKEFFELDLEGFGLKEPELVKISKDVGINFVRNVEELLKVIGL